MKIMIRRKVVLILLLICGVAVSILLISIRSKEYVYHSVRPDDFPEILIPPDNAEAIDYSAPSNSRRAPHTYELRFMVNESYPGENTHVLIENRLISHGWKKLKFNLLNPGYPARSDEWIDYAQMAGSKIKYLELLQQWISNKDETIFLTMDYLQKKNHEKDLDKLYVDLSFLDGHSWVRPFITKYKELHPEEFDDQPLQ